MKRKGARDIPDFSALKKGVKGVPGADRKGQSPAPASGQAAARTVKPQATSSKSGHRGQ